MRTTKKTLLFLSVLATLLLWYGLVPLAHGGTTPPPPTTPQYYPLVGIPGLQNPGQGTSVPQYINAIYMLVLGIGALIGVLKIAFAGVKYSMSDIITDKSEAKKDIMGVLLGLAILIIPFIVLNTIYPGLTNLDVLSGLKKIELRAPSNSTGAADFNTLSPNERTSLMNACGNNLYSSGNNSYCCADSSYTGSYRCSSSPSNTSNATGIDTNKVYASGGDIDQYLAGLETVNAFSVGAVTNTSNIQSECNTWSSGSTPILFKVRNSSGGAASVSNFLVCVK